MFSSIYILSRLLSSKKCGFCMGNRLCSLSRKPQRIPVLLFPNAQYSALLFPNAVYSASLLPNSMFSVLLIQTLCFQPYCFQPLCIQLCCFQTKCIQHCSFLNKDFNFNFDVFLSQISKHKNDLSAWCPNTIYCCNFDESFANQIHPISLC